MPKNNKYYDKEQLKDNDLIDIIIENDLETYLDKENIYDVIEKSIYDHDKYFDK